MCVSVCLQQDRILANNGVLTISSLNLADIGMYQCVAENKHGRIFTNAELRVIGNTKRARLCRFSVNTFSGVCPRAIAAMAVRWCVIDT